ncbi:MAG: aminotransferase class III-fold pyridoxal phosphate-dependent enzyme [Anaerolineales bacterium]
MTSQLSGHPLHPWVGHSYLRLVSGKGIFVTDASGKTYLDAVAGVGVVSLGYGREDVVTAAAEQARRIPYTHSMRFENEAQVRLADQLAAFCPPGLNWAFFCSGGSEALESAVKLIRQYWLDRGEPGKSKVIGRRPSFHGNTLIALSVGYHEARRERYMPYLVDMPHLPAPWIYRCEHHGMDGPYCDVCSGRALAQLIEAEGPDTVAAFIAEPILGAAAPAVTPPPGYYETIREICDQYDVLFVSDEIMCGIGRTGRNFGIEHWAAIPDLMLVAKGIAGGYASLAGVVAHDRVIEVLRAGAGRYEHNFTMAGNPIACAVGCAVLSAIEAEKVVAHVAELESDFFAMLDGLRRYPFVGDVRGRGLMAGIEFTQPGGREPYPVELGLARAVDLACREAGLLIYPCAGIVDGRQGDAVLLLPPLTITREEIALLGARLDAGLADASKAFGGA